MSLLLEVPVVVRWPDFLLMKVKHLCSSHYQNSSDENLAGLCKPKEENTNYYNNNQVLEFIYTGSIFKENGSLYKESETKCQKAKTVTYQL